MLLIKDSISFMSSFENPVVPIIIALPFLEATFMFSFVELGVVKSIITSALSTISSRLSEGFLSASVFSPSILYSSNTHLPRSMSLHFSEQKGLQGFSSHVVDFLHKGQIIFIINQRIIYKKKSLRAKRSNLIFCLQALRL